MNSPQELLRERRLEITDKELEAMLLTLHKRIRRMATVRLKITIWHTGVKIRNNFLPSIEGILSHLAHIRIFRCLRTRHGIPVPIKMIELKEKGEESPTKFFVSSEPLITYTKYSITKTGIPELEVETQPIIPYKNKLVVAKEEKGFLVPDPETEPIIHTKVRCMIYRAYWDLIEEVPPNTISSIVFSGKTFILQPRKGPLGDKYVEYTIVLNPITYLVYGIPSLITRILRTPFAFGFKKQSMVYYVDVKQTRLNPLFARDPETGAYILLKRLPASMFDEAGIKVLYRREASTRTIPPFNKPHGIRLVLLPGSLVEEIPYVIKKTLGAM